MSPVDIVTQLCTLDDGTVVQPNLVDVNQARQARGMEAIQAWQVAVAYFVALFTTKGDILASEEVHAVFGGEQEFKSALAAVCAEEYSQSFGDSDFMGHLEEKMVGYMSENRGQLSITCLVDGFAPGYYAYFSALHMRRQDE